MNPWQPIETAPKDGTSVDLWTTDGRLVECYWATDPKAGWYSFDLSHGCGGLLDEDGITATHWAPVVEPE